MRRWNEARPVTCSPPSGLQRSISSSAYPPLKDNDSSPLDSQISSTLWHNTACDMAEWGWGSINTLISVNNPTMINQRRLYALWLSATTAGRQTHDGQPHPTPSAQTDGSLSREQSHVGGGGVCSRGSCGSISLLFFQLLHTRWPLYSRFQCSSYLSSVSL